jgi:acetyl esterase
MLVHHPVYRSLRTKPLSPKGKIMTSHVRTVQLEADAQAFADVTANPPFAFQLGAEGGRTVLAEAQSSEVNKPPVEIVDRVIAGGPNGRVSIRILRPPGFSSPLPVIIYTHGGGWVFGDEHTHDRLIRELAVGANAAVVFTNYTRSPEAKYPTAIEECYAALDWAASQSVDEGFDSSRIVVAGDSAGGNITAELTLLAKERGAPSIKLQVLLYPVTDASFDTDSYLQFAEGHFLRRDGMMWFWDQYTATPTDRTAITASPLRATTEQLQGLPPTLVITAEADVLRDKGEAYARKLREAGVLVTAIRFQAALHDFMMLNALANTRAARGAIALVNTWLRENFAS